MSTRNAEMAEDLEMGIGFNSPDAAIERADKALAAARQVRAIRAAERRVQEGHFSNNIGERTVAQFELLDAALGEGRR